MATLANDGWIAFTIIEHIGTLNPTLIWTFHSKMERLFRIMERSSIFLWRSTCLMIFLKLSCIVSPYYRLP